MRSVAALRIINLIFGKAFAPSLDLNSLDANSYITLAVATSKWRSDCRILIKSSCGETVSD